MKRLRGSVRYYKVSKTRVKSNTENVYIAFGSNEGDRRAKIESAIENIASLPRTRIISRSRIEETEPLGGPPQGRFLNGVLKVRTGLGPLEFLKRLSDIEQRLGRRAGSKNGPRPVDLDMLFYGNRIIKSGRLTVPHPRLHERDFVLRPLRQLEPSFMHPVLRRSISSMAKRKNMLIIKKSALLKKRLKRGGGTIGLVPTMGYLHEGHLSLIRRARRECDTVVVSIFVNPTQFSPGEDYSDYPRDLRRDIRMCESVGADIIFHPSARDMYPDCFSTEVNVRGLTEGLCGAKRPGHFSGVATVVNKLFNIIAPTAAYFGQKDGQQAFMIKRMAADLGMAVKIHICPTVRESDGLAMSSRNIYLNKRQRAEAPVLYGALVYAGKMVRGGGRDAAKIIRAMRGMISSKSSARIDYISVVDTGSLRGVKRLRGEVMVALAAKFGKTRLIDNIIIKAVRKAA